MCKTADDDNCLESSFFLIGSAASLFRVASTAVDIPMPLLPVSPVRIQDSCYRRQHPQAYPHFLFLFMSNDFIFECSQRGNLTGGRRSTAQLRQYRRCRWACHTEDFAWTLIAAQVKAPRRRTYRKVREMANSTFTNPGQSNDDGDRWASDPKLRVCLPKFHFSASEVQFGQSCSARNART